jgi:hypothetical protein
MFVRHLKLGILSLFAAQFAHADDFQGATHMTPFDEDTIAYSKSAASGTVAKLQQRLDKGEVHLKRDEQFGYLLSMLESLGVMKSSQMLVFSKTSFQRERIDPKHPRGIYFNDDVYVGFVPGSPLLEVSEADPKLGAVFYTFDQSQPKPRFTRNDSCLECHASSKSMGVPGHLVRSFATDENGVIDLSSGTSLVNHRTPFEERWGGWYVTGTHGEQSHRGNLFGQAAFAQKEREPNFAGNQVKLDNLFDIRPYPEPTSDIVALMVLEHQTHMHNFITRLNYESTIALQQYGHMRYLKNVTEAFVRYLLFVEEAPLKSRVHGVSSFADEFAATGPRDKRGRSLRDFDLETRLFKFPCSYLIYSEAFAALPRLMKERVYARLFEILSSKEASADYKNLSPETRRAILEILADTKPDLPAEWRKVTLAKTNSNSGVSPAAIGQNLLPGDRRAQVAGEK